MSISLRHARNEKSRKSHPDHSPCVRMFSTPSASGPVWSIGASCQPSHLYIPSDCVVFSSQLPLSSCLLPLLSLLHLRLSHTRRSPTLTALPHPLLWSHIELCYKVFSDRLPFFLCLTSQVHISILAVDVWPSNARA